jgi:hypothetical protein
MVSIGRVWLRQSFPQEPNGNPQVCGYHRAGALVRSYTNPPKNPTDRAGNPPDDNDGAWDAVVTPMPSGRQ